MSRQRAHWIECDECGEQSDGSLGLSTAWEAADVARREGWLLGARRNGRRVDLCDVCRLPPAKRTPMVSDAEHRRRAAATETR